MTAFAPHPAGTDDLVKRLMAENLSQEIEYLNRIEQLEAALTRANAATAAAYEVAAQVLDDEIDMARIAFPQAVPILAADYRAIRALATPDQTAALDKLIAEAVAAKDAEIAQLNQDLDDMRDNAESAYRRGYWAGGNGA